MAYIESPGYKGYELDGVRERKAILNQEDISDFWPSPFMDFIVERYVFCSTVMQISRFARSRRQVTTFTLLWTPFAYPCREARASLA